jgi:hypothetical protein
MLSHPALLEQARNRAFAPATEIQLVAFATCNLLAQKKPFGLV